MFCRNLRKVSMVMVGSLLTMYSSTVLLDSGNLLALSYQGFSGRCDNADQHFATLY